MATSWCSKVLLAQSSDRQRAETSEPRYLEPFSHVRPRSMEKLIVGHLWKANCWLSQPLRRTREVCLFFIRGIVWKIVIPFFKVWSPRGLLGWLMSLPIVFGVGDCVASVGDRTASLWLQTRCWRRSLIERTPELPEQKTGYFSLIHT